MQHDLVKRVLWPARDRRDLGGAVQPGELRVGFIDEEGAPITGAELWQRLRAEAPIENAALAAGLAAFDAAVDRALAAAQADDLGGVLAFEADFGALARIVKPHG